MPGGPAGSYHKVANGNSNGSERHTGNGGNGGDYRGTRERSAARNSRASAGDVRVSPGRRRLSETDGLELSSQRWHQANVENAWDKEEEHAAMGGANGTARGNGMSTYIVVEPEEPLLDGEHDAPEIERGDGETVAASTLWSAGEQPSLRSHGDASLGPAFGRHGRSGGISDEGALNGDPPPPGSRRNGSPRGDPQDGSWAVSGRPLVYLCAMCSSLCSILLGYDVGVMSGAKEYIRPNLGLSAGQLDGVVGSLNIVAAFGGLLAGKAADRFGRKPTTALACGVFIAGATMMTISTTFWFLLLGRVVTGVGVGCAMVIAPVYITELAPPDVRGMLVSLTDICINVGIVLGYAACLVCADVFDTDSGKWRSMIGIGMLPPAVILGCLAMMPESPRWLISAGRQSEALDVLKRVLGDQQEAEDSLHKIVDATANQKEATWLDVLWPKDFVVKAAMVVGIGLGFWQQASGSEAAVYYTPEVLRQKGWGDDQILVGNIGVGGFKLIGEVVAFVLLDRIGRRPLFLASSVSVTLCLVMVGNAFMYNWTTWMTLFWLCMFMFCFSLGLGPVTFVVASEIFPVIVRGKAMSVVICVNRLMSGVIALSYESMSQAMTSAGSFYFFSLLSAISIVFYWIWVPETRGRTLEEITAELGASTSANGIGLGGVRHVPLPEGDEEDND